MSDSFFRDMSIKNEHEKKLALKVLDMPENMTHTLLIAFAVKSAYQDVRLKALKILLKKEKP